MNALLQLALGRSMAGYGWYVSYLQNYQIGRALNMGRDLPGLVGHTWSLAVEEQFYLNLAVRSVFSHAARASVALRRPLSELAPI